MNNDRITALEQQVAAIQAEIEQLKAEQAEVKPWRAVGHTDFFCIEASGFIGEYTDCDDQFDKHTHSIGNYYRTRELAEQDARELALRGRVRQLRDALCEGYQFRYAENNYCICFNSHKNEYYVVISWQRIDVGAIYFDTDEHAQQACDILNAERRKESGE